MTSSFAPEIPVVLTATVRPNVTGVASANAETRLAEYRQVLQFCLQFAPVIFLENSNYPLENHPEFVNSSRLQVHRFAPSATPERGKGFQEFEMLDAWLASEQEPPASWLKISGRYQLLNLPAFLAECRQPARPAMLIDQIARRRWARTYLFYTRTDFYQQQVRGLYRQCDDRAGESGFIETVLSKALDILPPTEVRLFQTQPRIRAVAGTTGTAFPSGRLQWLAKQMLRHLNRLVNEQRLLYPRS